MKLNTQHHYTAQDSKQHTEFARCLGHFFSRTDVAQLNMRHHYCPGHFVSRTPSERVARASFVGRTDVAQPDEPLRRTSP